MLNRGTLEGEQHEKQIVKLFNSNKDNLEFQKYLKSLEIGCNKNYWMCRVTTMQYSELSKSKVATRADAYLIYSEDVSLLKIIKDNNYYLDEDLLNNTQNIEFRKVPKSGISIKLSDSRNYQILKLTPNSFKELFGNTELGAGSSIYCTKTADLKKNKSVIDGWKTNEINMINFFANEINEEEALYLDEKFYENLEDCKKIKKLSNSQIKQRIELDENLKKKIFNGIYLYEEPYTAYYFIRDEGVVDLNYIPFNITTGSGRSRGDYTIVLKPKK